MEHKNFAEVLNDMLELTDCKMKDVAQYLSYDISFINKWVNGKNIPSAKTSELILDSLAMLFGKIIYDRGREEQLVELSERKLNAKSLDSIFAITRSILVDGYYASLYEDTTKLEEEYVDTILDPREIVSRAFMEIEKGISLSSHEINIFITLDLYQLFRKIFASDQIFYVTRGVRVNIHWLMQEDTTIFNEGLENELYYMMGKSSFFNTSVYLEKETFIRPYIYIENQLVMNFVLNTNKDIHPADDSGSNYFSRCGSNYWKQKRTTY